MGKGWVLGLLVLVSATPASAQVTKCGWELGKWVCRTNDPPPRPDIMGAGSRAFDEGYQRSQRLFDDYARARAEAEARRAAQQSAAVDGELQALELRRARAAAEEAEERARVARMERERQDGIEAVRRLIEAGNCVGAISLAKLNFGERGERDARELCPN